jgi:hypothetical protein
MDQLEQTRLQIKKIIETQIELGIMVHDFEATVESKDALVDRVYVRH